MQRNIPDAAALLGATYKRSDVKRGPKRARLKMPRGAGTVTLLGIVALLLTAVVAGTNAVLMAILG
jgi:hypothetical protein